MLLCNVNLFVSSIIHSNVSYIFSYPFFFIYKIFGFNQNIFHNTRDILLMDTVKLTDKLQMRERVIHKMFSLSLHKYSNCWLIWLMFACVCKYENVKENWCRNNRSKTKLIWSSILFFVVVVVTDSNMKIKKKFIFSFAQFISLTVSL